MLVFLCTLMFSLDDREQAQAKEFLKNGDELYNAGKYTEAIVEYDKAIASDPAYEDAYKNRGLAKYVLKNLDAAIVDFNQVIQLNSENVDAYYNRGLCKYYQRNYPGAISDFDKTIAKSAKDAEAYYMRGMAKTYVEDIEIGSACEDFERAKALGHGAAENMIKRYCTPEE